jgi:predicted PurR-regulated permease PerM
VLTGLGLWLVGIPLAWTLGLIAGLLDFVPNIGPLIGFLPAFLLAMAMGPTKALWVAVVYVLVQTIEGYLVTPLVQKRAVDLPPALTITGQLLMGVLAGPLGVLLATPLLAVGMVLVKILYVEETLGDEMETPDDRMERDAGQPLPEDDSR